MSAALSVVAFGAILIVVALISSRWTPLVGIGGLLVLLGLAKVLLP